MINIFWINIVILAAVSQWYIIEIKKEYPDKEMWMLIRGGIALVFMYYYLSNGYIYYWAILYMVGTFWFPFNTILNALRGKRIGYLSPENSAIDRILLVGLKYESIVFFVSFFVFFTSIAMMYFYGFCTYNQINDGTCAKY